MAQYLTYTGQGANFVQDDNKLIDFNQRGIKYDRNSASVAQKVKALGKFGSLVLSQPFWTNKNPYTISRSACDPTWLELKGADAKDNWMTPTGRTTAVNRVSNRSGYVPRILKCAGGSSVQVYQAGLATTVDEPFSVNTVFNKSTKAPQDIRGGLSKTLYSGFVKQVYHWLVDPQHEWGIDFSVGNVKDSVYTHYWGSPVAEAQQAGVKVGPGQTGLTDNPLFSLPYQTIKNSGKDGISSTFGELAGAPCMLGCTTMRAPKQVAFSNPMPGAPRGSSASKSHSVDVGLAYPQLLYHQAPTWPIPNGWKWTATQATKLNAFAYWPGKASSFVKNIINSPFRESGIDGAVQGTYLTNRAPPSVGKNTLARMAARGGPKLDIGCKWAGDGWIKCSNLVNAPYSWNGIHTTTGGTNQVYDKKGGSHAMASTCLGQDYYMELSTADGDGRCAYGGGTVVKNGKTTGIVCQRLLPWTYDDVGGKNYQARTYQNWVTTEAETFGFSTAVFACDAALSVAVCGLALSAHAYMVPPVWISLSWGVPYFIQNYGQHYWPEATNTWDRLTARWGKFLQGIVRGVDADLEKDFGKMAYKLGWIAAVSAFGFGGGLLAAEMFQSLGLPREGSYVFSWFFLGAVIVDFGIGLSMMDWCQDIADQFGGLLTPVKWIVEGGCKIGSFF